jgi:hypothetical protein
MSTGHARRAKTPAARIVGSGRKHLRLLSIALPVAVMLPAAYMVLDRPPVDEIETAIRGAGFDPLVPPNRLRGPGALYEVGDGFYRKVCDVDPALLEGKLKSSPIPDHHRERLEKVSFSLKGSMLDAVNAGLHGARLTSIEYRLAEVTMSEIDYRDLFDIEDNLLSQKNCEKAVKRLLQANRKVCPGYAALSATTSYKVHVHTEVRSEAEDRAPILHAVQHALQQRVDGQIQVQSGDELTGEHLFYGIQLSHLCITVQDDPQPSVLPQSASSGVPLAKG